VEKDSEREEPSVTGKFSVITFRALPSLPSDAWPAEAVLSESLDSYMKRPEVCSRCSLKTLSAMPLHILSTPKGRLLQLWMLSMH